MYRQRVFIEPVIKGIIGEERKSTAQFAELFKVIRPG
jgi:hypothetical protein